MVHLTLGQIFEHIFIFYLVGFAARSLTDSSLILYLTLALLHHILMFKVIRMQWIVTMTQDPYSTPCLSCAETDANKKKKHL